MGFRLRLPPTPGTPQTDPQYAAAVATTALVLTSLSILCRVMPVYALEASRWVAEFKRIRAARRVAVLPDWVRPCSLAHVALALNALALNAQQ